MNQETLGKYTLVRHIATGGMAEIWLAEQSGPGGFNKELVIKRILPHLATDTLFTGMFLDEARLVAQLTHPHIGQIFELGEIDGSYFIAMEYIDGVDLSKLLLLLQGVGRAIPVEYAVKIVCDVLAALDYAHEFADRDGSPLGLVHRDISPQNVLVSNDGAVKLVDFGVAKAADNSTKTQAGGVKGKFAYMSPEQIQGDSNLDRRVDVFAAGVLLSELLTGTKPFGDELMAVSQILKADAPDPRMLRPDIPEALVGIIFRALMKDRNERYQSAEAMLSDLEAFVYGHGLSVSARDLSVFIRELRGLPTPRMTVREVSTAPGNSGVQSSVPYSTPTSGMTGAVPYSTPTSGMTGAVSYSTPTKGTTGSGAQPTMINAPVGSGDFQAVEYDAEPESKRQPLLVAGFLLVMLLIVGASVTIGFLVINRNDDAADKPGVTEAVVPVEGKTPASAESSKFRHSGNSRTVYISTKPGTTIWYQGEKVGDSSLQTNLRPGKYDVELRYEGNRRVVSFEVESDKFINRVSF